jgi:acyl carrier protein
MAKTYEEIFPQVQSVLVEALGVDEDEVKPQSKLVQDLGAESIDFLDISFRLEKAFGIKIDQNEMFPENVLNDPAFVQEGKVTENGMSELRKRLPHADLTDFDQSRSVEDFSNVFTVDAVVKFVQNKLK